MADLALVKPNAIAVVEFAPP